MVEGDFKNFTRLFIVLYCSLPENVFSELLMYRMKSETPGGYFKIGTNKWY